MNGAPPSRAHSRRPRATPGTGSRALVLSGGGATGAYEVGVLKAVLGGKSPSTGYRDLDPEVFAGTSIGAFSAAFLLAQWDEYGATSVANLENAWREVLSPSPFSRATGTYRVRGNPFEVLNPLSYYPNPLRPWRELLGDAAYLTWDGIQRGVHFLTARDEAIEQRLAELFDFSIFLATEPWERTLRRTIAFEDIRRSSRILRIAATNWATGRLRVFNNQDMTERLGPLAIQCSTALPAVFPPTLIGAEPHADGSVLMNTPLTLALDVGATELHVVYLDPDIQSIPLSHLRNTLGTIYRWQTIAWAAMVNDDIEDAAAINRALAAVERQRRGLPQVAEEAELLVHGLQSLEWERLRDYRPLTIHRYHPRDDLAGGAMGLLNFDRERVADLIHRGYADAVVHDCEASGCVLPDPEVFASATSERPVREPDHGAAPAAAPAAAGAREAATEVLP